MRNRQKLLLLILATLSGCASWSLPKTTGDPQRALSYGYHPIDPLPVRLEYEGSITNAKILSALPDETMRIAIGQNQADGGITYGLVKAGVAGNSYVVILDYTKFETQFFGFTPPSIGVNISGTQIIVPVYVGIGLRLTANITVNEGSIDLGNLFALGAAAQAKQVSGTLMVQALGISGESVSTTIPMPSEINASTIRNAIAALGAIKANIYGTDTVISPRVVGVYNSLGGGQATIYGFISSLMQQPLTINLNLR